MNVLIECSNPLHNPALIQYSSFFRYSATRRRGALLKGPVTRKSTLIVASIGRLFVLGNHVLLVPPRSRKELFLCRLAVLEIGI